MILLIMIIILLFFSFLSLLLRHFLLLVINSIHIKSFDKIYLSFLKKESTLWFLFVFVFVFNLIGRKYFIANGTTIGG